MRLGPYACTTYPARRQGTWSKRRRCSRTVGYYRTEVVYPLIVFQIFAVRQASIRQLRPTDFSFRQYRMLTLPLHCLLLIEWSFIDRTWCRQHCGYRADCNAHTPEDRGQVEILEEESGALSERFEPCRYQGAVLPQLDCTSTDKTTTGMNTRPFETICC